MLSFAVKYSIEQMSVSLRCTLVTWLWRFAVQEQAKCPSHLTWKQELSCWGLIASDALVAKLRNELQPFFGQVTM